MDFEFLDYGFLSSSSDEEDNGRLPRQMRAKIHFNYEEMTDQKFVSAKKRFIIYHIELLIIWMVH